MLSVAVDAGFGEHSGHLPLPELIRALKFAWIAQIPAVLSKSVSRISIGILILRLFSVHKWLVWFVIIVLILNTSICILALMMVFLQCTPVAALWNPLLAPTAKCWNPVIQRNFAVASSGQSRFLNLNMSRLTGNSSDCIHRPNIYTFPCTHCLETEHEAQNKNCPRISFEPGDIVRHFHACQMFSLSSFSAMTACIVSTVVLLGLSARADFTCESSQVSKT